MVVDAREIHRSATRVVERRVALSGLWSGKILNMPVSVKP